MIDKNQNYLTVWADFISTKRLYPLSAVFCLLDWKVTPPGLLFARLFIGSSSYSNCFKTQLPPLTQTALPPPLRPTTTEAKRGKRRTRRRKIRKKRRLKGSKSTSVLKLATHQIQTEAEEHFWFVCLNFTGFKCENVSKTNYIMETSWSSACLSSPHDFFI